MFLLTQTIYLKVILLWMVLYSYSFFQDRCDRIAEQIKIAADEKIAAIFTAKDKMLMDAANLQKSSEMSAIALQASLEEAKSVANKAMESSNSENENDRVSLVRLIKTAVGSIKLGHSAQLAQRLIDKYFATYREFDSRTVQFYL